MNGHCCKAALSCGPSLPLCRCSCLIRVLPLHGLANRAIAMDASSSFMPCARGAGVLGGLLFYQGYRRMPVVRCCQTMKEPIWLGFQLRVLVRNHARWHTTILRYFVPGFPVELLTAPVTSWRRGAVVMPLLQAGLEHSVLRVLAALCALAQ